MKAWVVMEAGGPFQVQKFPMPQPRQSEVLIRIAASGVNPLDTKIRAGHAAHANHPLPAVLGLDFSGTIEALGSNVHEFQVGDEVYGMAGGVAGIQGSLAEYMVADASLIARKPRNLSMVEAAAMPLGVITAWEGLVDRARIQAGNAVLIHGGAGGVGHMAVQLALAFGANVHATVSADKAKLVARYDAIPIDYKKSSVEEYIQLSPGGHGWDIVYDTVGGETLDASFRAVKTYTGHALSCLGWGTYSLAPLSFRGATYSGVFTLLPLLSGEHRAHHGEILARATSIAESGKLTPLMNERVYSTDALEEAHLSVTKGALGKVVVRIVP